MSRVITFSRVFPSYHQRKGEPTNFIRSIWEGLDLLNLLHTLDDSLLEDETESFYRKNQYNPKYHTIRAGNRWKVGDWFSPRVWSGRPYNSKQIVIAPDIQIKRVFDFKIEIDNDYICVLIDDYPFYEENKNLVTQIDALETLAQNDGLSISDFKNWFRWGKKHFTGQIICWNKEIEY